MWLSGGLDGLLLQMPNLTLQYVTVVNVVSSLLDDHLGRILNNNGCWTIQVLLLDAQVRVVSFVFATSTEVVDHPVSID